MARKVETLQVKTKQGREAGQGRTLKNSNMEKEGVIVDLLRVLSIGDYKPCLGRQFRVL